MKKKNILAILALLSIVGCAPQNSSSEYINSSSENSIYSEESSEQSSEQISSEEISSENSSISSAQSSASNEPQKRPIDEERKKDYQFTTKVTDTLPSISINTPDESNEWATKFNRNDKLNNLIDYVDATISTSNCDEDQVLTDVDAEVKVRGNYTLEYDKKPIRIKFKKRQSLLGLNDDASCKSWVLLADYKDRSMLNNATSFYLGNTILGSDGYYSTDYKYVNVYLNGKYWGMYLLVEQQQFDKYRMDFAEPDDDYEGTDIGYLLEYDGYYDLEDPNKGGDYTFEVNYDNWRAIENIDGERVWAGVKGYTIKSDITHKNQVNFIASYLENVYRIIYRAIYDKKAYSFNEDYTSIAEDNSISAMRAIKNVINVDSLVGTYLLNEIACDPDIAWSSFYMSVSFEEGVTPKLTFQAPWDFDSAYGIKNGFVNDGLGLYAAKKNNPWLTLLINQTWFQTLIKTKWNELVDYEVLDNSLKQVERVKTIYVDDFAKEYTRWPGRTYNGELTHEVNSIKSQAGAADYLYNWLTIRYNYLNTVWGDKTVLYK